MIWFRIDSRLVHGQVIEAWLPYLRAHYLVVVNDVLANDLLRQQIMQLAIPERISVIFSSVSDVKDIYEQLRRNAQLAALFLVSDCRDAERIKEQGVDVPVLNIGNMHYAPGKEQICAHVALSPEEKDCLKHLEASGTILDFRSVPDDSPNLGAWHA